MSDYSLLTRLNSAAFYRAEQAEPLVLAGARQAYQPKIYNLLVNYRSHRGITNVAAALVDAIIHFFPSAIDSLGREMGIVDGTLPVIFEGFDNDSDLRLESFLFGAGDTTMEFGKIQSTKQLRRSKLTCNVRQAPSSVSWRLPVSTVQVDTSALRYHCQRRTS